MESGAGHDWIGVDRPSAHLSVCAFVPPPARSFYQSAPQFARPLAHPPGQPLVRPRIRSLAQAPRRFWSQNCNEGEDLGSIQYRRNC